MYLFNLFRPSVEAARKKALREAQFHLLQHESQLAYSMHMVSYLQETIHRLESQIPKEEKNIL